MMLLHRLIGYCKSPLLIAETQRCTQQCGRRTCAGKLNNLSFFLNLWARLFIRVHGVQAHSAKLAALVKTVYTPHVIIRILALNHCIGFLNIQYNNLSFFLNVWTRL